MSKAALNRAIDTISPTAPPDKIAEALRELIDELGIPDQEVSELVIGCYKHFKIDLSGPPVMAILRSGYQIKTEQNIEHVTAHLKNAIVGESLSKFHPSSDGSWKSFWKELGSGPIKFAC